MIATAILDGTFLANLKALPVRKAAQVPTYDYWETSIPSPLRKKSLLDRLVFVVDPAKHKFGFSYFNGADSFTKRQLILLAF